jgi:hypothetical protein
MNILRLILLPTIACALAIGGCATTSRADAPAYPLPPIRDDMLARLAVDGPNAYINNARVPHGSYVRDGDVVTTGPGTSVNLIMNSGASIQLDQNTDPLFRLIRQGACVLMEIVRGQAAVATNGACVEFRSERLDTAGVAHSVIDIVAAEHESRVTVIEGQVDMFRPGAAALRTYDQYVGSPDGTWQVRQLAPEDAMATGAWTRNYFRPPPRAQQQQQSNILIPVLIGIGLGAYFGSQDGDHKREPRQEPQSGPSGPADRPHAPPQQQQPQPPPAPAPPSGDYPQPGASDAPSEPRYPPRRGGPSAGRHILAAGLCCLPGGGSMPADSMTCARRNGQFHPAPATPDMCPAAVR